MEVILTKVKLKSPGSWGMMLTVLALFLRWLVAAMRPELKESGNITLPIRISYNFWRGI